MKYSPVQNYIGGKFVDASSARTLQVISPLDGNLLSTVPISTAKDLDMAVQAAKAAFPAWSKTPIKERVQVFFRYKYLLEKNMKELSELVQEENGKTYSEATAEIEKSIELTEFACSLPQLVTGEILEVSRGVECRTEHIALGVVASIVPFNFPSMVPNWTLPNAIALGNCMIMKPSEKVPLSCARLAQLLKEAGLPDGVFNIVNGDSEIVTAICDHPGIEAVSFVGSTKVAKIDRGGQAMGSGPLHVQRDATSSRWAPALRRHRRDACRSQSQRLSSRLTDTGRPARRARGTACTSRDWPLGAGSCDASPPSPQDGCAARRRRTRGSSGSPAAHGSSRTSRCSCARHCRGSRSARG